MLRGWNSHTRRELPGSFESTNLSRDNPIREIGRYAISSAPRAFASAPAKWVLSPTGTQSFSCQEF